jgi:murein DD-endopeptidase MepM/ murein hydrolase activator NlpD
MKAIISALLCLLLYAVNPSIAAEPDLNELITPAPDRSSSAVPLSQPCVAYNELNNRIRDGRIGKVAARKEFAAQLAEIRAEYYRRGGVDYSPTKWLFPLAGYSAGAIGAGRGHGFTGRGYDFFSGNRHGGHPAYDIFIRDRNRDCRDDRSGAPVKVLSMTGGIVVALEKSWQSGSKLRGGRYVWVFDPANNLLVYYAHNEELYVEVGTLVKPGDLLATVGRSGFNAAKKRSPTHLHFSVLTLDGGQPAPEQVYRRLTRLAGVAAEVGK